MSTFIGSSGIFRFDKPISEALREKINKFHLVDWYKWKDEPIPDSAYVDWNAVKSEMPKNVTAPIPTSWCPWRVTQTAIETWYADEVEEVKDCRDFISWLIFFMQVYLMPNGINLHDGSGEWEDVSGERGSFHITHNLISWRNIHDYEMSAVRAHNRYVKHKIAEGKAERDDKRYFINPYACKYKEIPRAEIDGFVEVRKSVYDRVKRVERAVEEVDGFIATCGIDKVYTTWITLGSYREELVDVVVEIDSFDDDEPVRKHELRSVGRQEREYTNGIFIYQHGWKELKVDHGKLQFVRAEHLNQCNGHAQDEVSLVKCRRALLKMFFFGFCVDTDELREGLAGMRLYDGCRVQDCVGVWYQANRLTCSRDESWPLNFEVCEPPINAKEISFDEFVNTLYGSSWREKK